MKNISSFLIIVQARQNSVRFPNKIIKKVCGYPLIYFLINRLSLANFRKKNCNCYTEGKRKFNIKKITFKKKLQCFLWFRKKCIGKIL